jgi:hypothetical protein
MITCYSRTMVKQAVWPTVPGWCYTCSLASLDYCSLSTCLPHITSSLFHFISEHYFTLLFIYLSTSSWTFGLFPGYSCMNEALWILCTNLPWTYSHKASCLPYSTSSNSSGQFSALISLDLRGWWSLSWKHSLCWGLNVCCPPPQKNWYVEILTPNVMVLGG